MILHWPEATFLDLWLFSMEYAVYIYNRLPKQPGGPSPLEVFSNSQTDPNWVRRSWVFGCPAYVLDPKVQDGKKLPRWQPKSCQGQFLGRLSRHARNIGLIRNIKTGNVSTQFHVVYDNFFTTVRSLPSGEVPETWSVLYNTS